MSARSRYAYYGEENRIIHISEITSHTTGQSLGSSLICLDCRKQVQANIEKTAGSSFIRRFSHISQEACSGSEGETILHIQAKEIIKSQKQIRVPEYVLAELKPQRKHTSLAHMTDKQFDNAFMGDYFEREDISERNYLIQPIQNEKTITFETVRLEERIGSFIPDCIATTAHGTELCIEICVTNPVSDEKLDWYASNAIPSIEIDISHLYLDYHEMENPEHNMSLDNALVHAVINQTANKTWIYHPKHSWGYERLFNRYMAYAKTVRQTEINYNVNQKRRW